MRVCGLGSKDAPRAFMEVPRTKRARGGSSPPGDPGQAVDGTSVLGCSELASPRAGGTCPRALEDDVTGSCGEDDRGPGCFMEDGEGLRVEFISEDECAFLYDEIFVRQEYLQHGIFFSCSPVYT